MRNSVIFHQILGLTFGIALGFFLASHWPPGKKISPPSDQNIATTQGPESGTHCARNELAESAVCPPCGAEAKYDPPSFQASVPATIVANLEAEAHVRWTKVSGAPRYRLYITDKAGRVVKSYSTGRTELTLKELPRPKTTTMAEYWISLASLNSLGLPGPRGEKRKLIVHGRPDLVAPKIMLIRIED
jgi:hypothetical protein